MLGGRRERRAPSPPLTVIVTAAIAAAAIIFSWSIGSMFGYAAQHMCVIIFMGLAIGYGVAQRAWKNYYYDEMNRLDTLRLMAEEHYRSPSSGGAGRIPYDYDDEIEES